MIPNAALKGRSSTRSLFHNAALPQRRSSTTPLFHHAALPPRRSATEATLPPEATGLESADRLIHVRSNNKLGLIAGNGNFPLLMLDAARAQGAEVVVAAIK